MLLGIGTEKAITAAVIYLFAHSLFKGALFMVAGGIDHGTGTRDREQLGGLWGVMPITATAALLAVLSMAGVAPFVGFLAKEVIYAASLKGANADVLTGIAVFGNIMMGAIAAMAGVGPFIGKRKATPHAPHEGPPSLWLGPVVLAGLGFVSAVMLSFSEEFILLPAAGAVWGSAVDIHLHLWEGVTTPFILSMATIGGAFVLFLIGPSVAKVLGVVLDRMWGPDTGYDQALKGLRWLAQMLTGILQTGKLSSYLFLTTLTLALAMGVPIWVLDLWPKGPLLPNHEVDFFVYAICFFTVLGAAIILYTRQRLAAILSLGLIGFSVGLIFLLFGAPDLAFTQFMVETLAVVILALVLLRLPVDDYDRRHPLTATRDAIVAIAAGSFITVLLIVVTSGPLDMHLSDYFTANSYTEAKGRNIVNVILVDFRAIDTLGEITVLVIAGMAGLATIGSRAVWKKNREGGKA
jgi:multicomponent Na+:H+ antiporter subunit A